jgi:hypothetical protein
MKIMNLRNIKGLSLLIICVVLAGCVTHRQGQQMLPDMYQSEFYVERQPRDGRNLQKNIANILRDRGFNVSHGEQGQAPENADYIVSYIDMWNWDMRMYLMSLRIEVRDRSTNHIVAYGESRQSSLAATGKTHDDIINTALDEMISQGSITSPQQHSE